jgi:hypothetical protein
MTDDLEAATDRVFAAMDNYRTGEAVHATRQVAQALARAALEGVREGALQEAAEIASVIADRRDAAAIRATSDERISAYRCAEAAAITIENAIRALISKAD